MALVFRLVFSSSTDTAWPILPATRQKDCNATVQNTVASFDVVVADSPEHELETTSNIDGRWKVEQPEYCSDHTLKLWFIIRVAVAPNFPYT